jgi:hypothetical protein
MQSSKVAPVPPKMSRALPIVKSTLPPLQSLTRSRSWTPRPPPAYVTGIEHQSASFETSCWSMPRCSPSLSAAWMRNSEQYGSSMLIDSLPAHQPKKAIWRFRMRLTLGNFHLRDGLPLVHSHEPGHALTAAAKVNDKLASIIVQSQKYFPESS